MLKLLKDIGFIVILIVILSLCKEEVWSQNNETNFGVQRITTEIQKTIPGISQNTIRCIYTDHKGMMWLGTWDGLNRFDGIRFDIIRMKVGDSKISLSNNTINAINQDQQNNLWIGTDGGINYIEYADLKRINLAFKNKSKILSDTIHSIFVDKSNRVWLAGQNGLAIINANRDSILPFSKIINDSTELDNIEIRQIVKTQEGLIWIGTAKGLFKFDKQKNKITHYSKPEISDNHITFIKAFKDSILFIGTENGLNLLNLKTNFISKKHPFSPDLQEIGENVFLSALLNDDKLLCGIAVHGLYIYNIPNDKFTPFEIPNAGNRGGDFFDTQNEDITCILKDDYENLWLGTAWNGIICISPEPLMFKKFGENISGLNDMHIWSLCIENNNLWIGTEKGLNIYSKNTHKMSYLTKENGLSSNRIRSIVKDRYGRMWVGTFDKGLNIINKDCTIIHLEHKDTSSSLPDNSIWHIEEDNTGFMWISTKNGLAKINSVNLSSTIYKNDPKDSTSLSSNTIFSTSFDKMGRLWVSTYHGLNLFQPKTNNFKRYYHEEGNYASLSTNKIFKVYDDGEGYLWIATIGGGLNRLNLNSGEIKWFTTKDGLSNNIIYSLIDDGMGNLWLSSNLGINRFNKHTHIINKYSVDDGLQSSEFNFGADLIDSNNNIYMGGMKGFNVFYPNIINTKDYNADLCISSFYVNQVGDIYDINFGDTVYLKPSVNSFEIKYTKLNFKNSSKELFRHKLINYEPTWINTSGNIAKATYTNLPSGTYVFSLQSAAKFGVWNTEPHLLTIIKQEYWYKTFWFISAVTIILFLIMIGIIRMRFQRVKFKSEMEKQIYQLEKQSLSLQMNPHFVFNTLNSIQSFILNNDKEESISYLSKFSKLMRSTLNNSSESIISLDNEIEMLNQYILLEQLRFDNGFDFEINVDKDIDKEFVGIPGMLIQIYVENAIIHGLSPLKERRGVLKISFKITDNMLQCTIEDNGVGREFHKNKSESFHVSKGMLISKKRLEILNRKSGKSPLFIDDLVDSKGKGIGTKVILLIDIEDISD